MFHAPNLESEQQKFASEEPSLFVSAILEVELLGSHLWDLNVCIGDPDRL